MNDEPLVVADVVKTFRRWLYLPSELPLLAVLGTIAANRLEGDPVWLLLVGPPGGGKSELLQAAGQVPNVHPTSTLTEPSLLSATPKRDVEQGSKGGLLREVGDFGILLLKDFGSVLSMHREGRAAVLAALREIYDGSWTRHVGTGGGKTFHWSGKVGLLAGCPPTIDRHHAVMGAMGERFVLMRLPEVDTDEQARRALDHAGHERKMREQLSDAVARLFLEPQFTPRRLEETERSRLVALTTLVVRCRSAVERDSYSRQIELIPGSEAPTRLVIVLERLLGGLDSIGVERAQAWDVVNRIALDSMPALRRSVLDELFAEGELGTPAIAEATRHPEKTVERALQDLTGHNVVELARRGEGKKPNIWRLTEWAHERYLAVACPSEVSEDIYEARSLSSSTSMTGEDKTGGQAAEDPESIWGVAR